MNTFLKNNIPKVQKMRDELAATCDEIKLTNGTVIFSKKQALAHINLYDDLLSMMKRLFDTAEVDQEHPQP
jgi:hypothetical protein